MPNLAVLEWGHVYILSVSGQLGATVKPSGYPNVFSGLHFLVLVLAFVLHQCAPL